MIMNFDVFAIWTEDGEFIERAYEENINRVEYEYWMELEQEEAAGLEDFSRIKD